MKLEFRYTGGQLYNYSTDYGAEVIKNKLPEFFDCQVIHNKKIAYFWKVGSDKESKAFESAIAQKCPELLTKEA